MASSHEAIESLRAAVKVSPDNVPLRMLLGDALAGVGRFDEAEVEYSVALAGAPGDAKLMLLLANVCFQAGKYSKALVLVEDLIRRDDVPAKAYLLYARLMLNEGRVQQAADNYRRAVKKDSDSADPELAERLGIGAGADSEVVDGRVRQSASGFEDDDAPVEMAGGAILELSDISFEDIGGMDQVKEQIRMKIIYPLTHADTYKAYGKKIGGGILMYGPPGCGKTYLARATAGEIDARFLSVGLHHVLDMWIGNSERNLHQIFEVARANKPCVLFFDEVDALAASRSDMKHSASRHLINQFLSELDGVDTNNEGLLILAATNAPWHVDPAFRRPGRFDRILFVPPPDAPARATILRLLLRGKPIENIDFDSLGKRTDKYSGADLKALVDVVVEAKIAAAMKEGKPSAISTKDIDKSLKAVKPSTNEWFSSARNYAVYANEGGLYDDILKYLKI